MSWDVKYRPIRYEDVLGQNALVLILRQIVMSGKGYHQSYLFTGPFGTGKTTLARILARALLCSDPKSGAPCDECRSCKELLRTGNSEAFTEIDAATNSGKEGIRRILETNEYTTFSGKRRIYIFDESHQLSRDALDALLKPLEDTRGSGERKLVCIFCTTEPERMRETIGSRCGPTFSIRSATPKVIAERLAQVCEWEKVPFEEDALLSIAEGAEGHIRDALKACEMLSVQGSITAQSVNEYLGHDQHDLLICILENLGSNAEGCLEIVDRLMVKLSPSMLYEKLANTCLVAYKLLSGLGRPPSYWDGDRLRQVALRHGVGLLELCEFFSSRPRRPTKNMLLCDLLSAHHRLLSGTQIGSNSPVLSQPKMSSQGLQPQTPQQSVVETPVAQEQKPPAPILSKPTTGLSSAPGSDTNYLTSSGVYAPPWAKNRDKSDSVTDSPVALKEPSPKGEDRAPFSWFSSQGFSLLVSLRARELATGVPSEVDAIPFSSLVKHLLAELRARSGSEETEVT